MKAVSSDKFVEFLINRIPHYDEQILRDIRPQKTKIVPQWWKTREAVRKLSEGIAFDDSKKVVQIVEDGWIGKVNMGTFHSFGGGEYIFDKINVDCPQIDAWKPE